MNTGLLITVYIILIFLAIFVIPRFTVMRAARKVIGIFRQAGAISPDRAKTAAELGLEPKPLLQRMMHMRDHKPNALHSLIMAGIVQDTGEGKLYLLEEKLAGTKLAGK